MGNVAITVLSTAYENHTLLFSPQYFSFILCINYILPTTTAPLQVIVLLYCTFSHISKHSQYLLIIIAALHTCVTISSLLSLNLEKLWLPWLRRSDQYFKYQNLDVFNLLWIESIISTESTIWILFDDVKIPFDLLSLNNSALNMSNQYWWCKHSAYYLGHHVFPTSQPSHQPTKPTKATKTRPN